MKGAYYNEFEPFAAAWLRALISKGLIAPGEVDERSIEEVQPDDLRGYTQHHFFAGLGGWSYALRLAGWPDTRSVWTGSCPCQPFSSASRGRGKRLVSDKHLWPRWQKLIAAKRPGIVFGEQVASALDWLDQVWDDMEALNYTTWAFSLPSVSVGADHIRPRLYFACYSDSYSESGLPLDGQVARVPRACSERAQLAETDGLPRRMAVMRAFGNAVDPWVASEFVKAAMP